MRCMEFKNKDIPLILGQKVYRSAPGPMLKNFSEVTRKQTSVGLCIPHAAKDVFRLSER